MDQGAPGAGFGLDRPDDRHLGELLLGLWGQGRVSFNLGDLETHPPPQGMGYFEALYFHPSLRNLLSGWFDFRAGHHLGRRRSLSLGLDFGHQVADLLTGFGG